MGTLAFAALVALASLNRETGVVLVLVYAFWQGPRLRQRGVWLRLLGFAAIYIGVTVGLRLSLGSAEHTLGLLGTLQTNLTMIKLRQAIPRQLGMAPIWILAWMNRKASPLLARLLWVIPLYGVLYAFGGMWHEVRLWWLVLPIALAAAFAEREVTE